MKGVKKAIIPAAGHGFRMLPATKAIPKEMLPLGCVPAIEYAVKECVESGIEEILIVLSRGKEAIENHFDAAPELERVLEGEKKHEALSLLRRYEGVRFSYVRQARRGGTGEAVALGREFAAREPVAVLYPDDVMDAPVPVTKQLIKAYETTSSAIVGVQERTKEEAALYGIVLPGMKKGRYLEVKGFKEKPRVEEVTSPYTSLGRFIVTPDLMEEIERTPAGYNGEVQLSDAIDRLAKHSSVYAYEFEGKRYDLGNKLGYLEANVEFALKSAEGGAVRAYLEELLKKGSAE